MSDAAQKYADRLIDTISDCLYRCQLADDTVGCAQEFVARLRADPSWHSSDTVRVERAVMRSVQPIQSRQIRLHA